MRTTWSPVVTQTACGPTAIPRTPPSWASDQLPWLAGNRDPCHHWRRRPGRTRTSRRGPGRLATTQIPAATPASTSTAARATPLQSRRITPRSLTATTTGRPELACQSFLDPACSHDAVKASAVSLSTLSIDTVAAER
jgi:hypothetical protein